MAQSARWYRPSRRDWLFAGIATGLSIPLFQARGSEPLVLRRDGDILYVSAPGLHFLAGKPLQRLRDGASVVFVSQLSLSLDANRTILRRLPERFALSYDLWEERFSVARLGGSPRTVHRLSAQAAEAWCLESLAISSSGIPPDKPFWVRLDLRAMDPRDEAGVVGDSGISLTRLIETFSHPARTQQPHWTLEAGPLRLNDLKAERRGSRSG